jgi:hypothetical protein
MRRSFLAAAVALPLFVLALGIVRSERHLADGRRWWFEVTGYDPRDLLRGHYIQYRLALDEIDLPVVGAADGVPCDDETGDACCLCLSQEVPGGPAAFVERTTCELARSECEGALQLRYLGELERYYIAEERAAELTQIFQDASSEHRAHLVVAIDALGKPQIVTLLVDDMPVEQARRPPKDPASPPRESEAATSLPGDSSEAGPAAGEDDAAPGAPTSP